MNKHYCERIIREAAEQSIDCDVHRFTVCRALITQAIRVFVDTEINDGILEKEAYTKAEDYLKAVVEQSIQKEIQK